MVTLRATAKRINSWYAKGFRPIVNNGQQEYMAAFRNALKAADIEYHVSWTGKGYRLCSIYVKAEDLEQAQIACQGLPRDWYSAMPKENRWPKTKGGKRGHHLLVGSRGVHSV